MHTQALQLVLETEIPRADTVQGARMWHPKQQRPAHSSLSREAAKDDCEVIK